MPSPAIVRPTLRRSVHLLRAFRHEQDDPARFYGALAEDSVGQLRGFVELSGSTVLDVGGGPGWFAAAFRRAGARYVCLDMDAGDLAGAATEGTEPDGRLRGSGLALPLADASVDVAYSSNVAEHVREPARLLAELVRVVKPGGVAVLSYTAWWSPWGGHETAPWHYLGGERAARRYERTHGRPPKNRYGRSLFAWTVADGLGWVAAQPGVEVLALRPRYHPSWAWWTLRVPVLREATTWNLIAILRRVTDR